MSALDRIAELQKKLEATKKKHVPIFNEERRIEQEIKANQILAIAEGRMLQRHAWEIQYDDRSEAFYLTSGPLDEFPEFDKLLNDGWGRYSIELARGVTLEKRDGRLGLVFRNAKVLAGFVYEHALPISRAFLDDDMRKLQDKLSTLRGAQDVLKSAHAAAPLKPSPK